jgi:hypothetical protein
MDKRSSLLDLLVIDEEKSFQHQHLFVVVIVTVVVGRINDDRRRDGHPSAGVRRWRRLIVQIGDEGWVIAHLQQV